MQGTLATCAARLESGILTLENDLIRRGFQWNRGHLIGRELTDIARERTWALSDASPDCTWYGLAEPNGDGDLNLLVVEETPIVPAHLCAEVTVRLDGIEVKRRFRLFPGCPAIACDYYLRGEISAADVDTIIERLALGPRHSRDTVVRFYDKTDERNTLVESRAILPYFTETPLTGNLLLIEYPLDGSGIFLLKEAPCSDMQLTSDGIDFLSHRDSVRALGVGLTPADLHPTEWTRGYGMIVGIAGGGVFELLAALRAYQSRVRRHLPDRDRMVLLNTWGDRSEDTRIGEEFALAELRAGARLGVSHFQLDLGWQQGRDPGSPESRTSLHAMWNESNYWGIHSGRFPNGFDKIAQEARRAGIELCLWFNPSADDSYAHWQDDAAVLVEMHRRYGIRTFKIDGVELPDKRAELNLRALLDRVMDATGMQGVFNLDVTAGRRFGYHYFNEYGNIFIENRYTDWSNYYPHWTLRNLWMLARYAPPQSFQIEFLNKWRNPDSYPADDPLAPANIPFDYCFAIAMPAQPLAWFEASQLPEEAFAIAPLIKSYRALQSDLQSNPVFPIGSEPDGTSWTGFQSVGENGGYFLVYRELNDRPAARLPVLRLAGKQVRCTSLLGHGADFTEKVDGEGLLTLHLPEVWTFGVWKYEVQTAPTVFQS